MFVFVNFTSRNKGVYTGKQSCEQFIIVQALEEEEKMTPEQLAIKNVGKLDPKRHLEEKVSHWLMAF
jgi:hypothetical protein